MDSNLVECFGLICISALLSWDISCLMLFLKIWISLSWVHRADRKWAMHRAQFNLSCRKESTNTKFQYQPLIFFFNKCLIKWFHIFDLFTTLEMWSSAICRNMISQVQTYPYGILNEPLSIVYTRMFHRPAGCCRSAMFQRSSARPTPSRYPAKNPKSTLGTARREGKY